MSRWFPFRRFPFRGVVLYTIQEKMTLLLLTVFTIDTLQGNDDIIADSRSTAAAHSIQDVQYRLHTTWHTERFDCLHTITAPGEPDAC